MVVNCKARERLVHKFKVRNPTASPITFAVESDISHVSGDSQIVVPQKGSAEYKLTLHPLLGGLYSGSITFTAPDGSYQWYTVEVNAESPDPEQILELSTFVRKAVAVEIGLENPLDEPIMFDVRLTGDGLLGDPTFLLSAREAATMSFSFHHCFRASSLAPLSFPTKRSVSMVRAEAAR